MSIHLPEGLPARGVLEREGIEFFDLHDPLPRGILPLRIALVNLMPRKEDTEIRLARLLGAQTLPVELVPVITGQRGADDAADDVSIHHESWCAIRHQSIDALIVSDAPLETLRYEDVPCWPELCEIFDWALRAVPRTLFIGWSAQAALYHRHGAPGHALADKAFGVFKQTVRHPGAAVLRGFDGDFWVPVSRRSEVRAKDVPAHAGIDILAASPETGLGLLEGDAGRSLYMLDHLDYDTDTLAHEHARDVATGTHAELPKNYYPGDDADRPPRNRWRPFAHMLFANWLAEVERARFTAIDAAA